MSDDSDVRHENESTTDPKSSVVRRPFNPMVSYVEMVALIGAGYGLLMVFSYAGLVAVMLFALILLYRETLYILKHMIYGFARKAAYFNAGHSTAYFIILLVNSYTIMQFGTPLILPEIEQLTFLSPLFVVMGVFGTANIRRMYEIQR
ncbi:MAG: hypothetical protein RTU92_06600 [Candidatus Thorarchaeota archaeon]